MDKSIYYGYTMYFKYDKKVLLFPITPGELTIKSGSNNKVVNLINNGDVNILKSPALTEVEFEARFPMRKYPYAREFKEFQTYVDVFKELKEKKKSFYFYVLRTTPNGKRTWDTELLVTLEEFEINENADNGDDVLVNFKLKQYKEYKVITYENKKTTTSTSSTPRPAPAPEPTKHTVKSGDCLWNIAKKYYGNGAKYTKIYEANKTVIENTAKKYGRKSSSNGHWIYPGTVLTIPA